MVGPDDEHARALVREEQLAQRGVARGRAVAGSATGGRGEGGERDGDPRV
jgi:hypothetical protein